MSQSLNAMRDIPLEQGYAMLCKEGEKPKPRPEVTNGELPLNAIRFATSVFQPRLGDGTKGDSAAHVSALAEGVRNAKDHRLEPVLVWWSGKHWRVIDGHHRLTAYKQVNDPGQSKASKKWIAIDRIPVEVFEGTLLEAMGEAAARNAKDKLKMTKRDKLERAWKFTTLGGMTIPQIAKVTTVSERTVSNMRKAAAELGKEGPGDFGPRVNTMSITWEDAKRLLMGEKPKDDEWVERTASEWADRFSKTFGNKLAQNPALTLRALEIYSERLPARLIELYNEDNGPGDDEGGDES